MYLELFLNEPLFERFQTHRSPLKEFQFFFFFFETLSKDTFSSDKKWVDIIYSVRI